MARKEIQLSCNDCGIRFCSIFNELRKEDVLEVDAEKEVSLYRKGQIIFYEGTHPKGIYVVYTGKVKISKLGSNAREQIVRLARPGDVLGYRSLIGGDKYFASASTIEDSTICFIPRELLFRLLSRNGSLSLKIMQQLSQDLAAAERKMVELVQKPVRERLAESLLVLREIYGTEEDRQTLGVVLTREDLASLIGTTTETAIRILSDFKDDGLVALEKKKIKLLSLPRLIRESHIND